MMPITAQDTGNLMQALYTLHACPAIHSVREQIVNVLRVVFGRDAGVCERWRAGARVGTRGATGLAASEGAEHGSDHGLAANARCGQDAKSPRAAQADSFEVLPWAHPLLCERGLPLLRPFALSDEMDQKCLRETTFYRDYLRPRGAADQLLVVLTGTDLPVVAAVNRRTRGFTMDERADMASIAPALALACERALRAEAHSARKFRSRMASSAIALATPTVIQTDLTAGVAKYSPEAMELTMRMGDQIRDSIPEALSPRLRETFDSLGAGRCVKQVAIDLRVSHETARKYVKELYRRLDVSTRGELLARFVSSRRGGEMNGTGGGKRPVEWARVGRFRRDQRARINVAPTSDIRSRSSPRSFSP